MKEEILTAKEWLEKETNGYFDLFSDIKYEEIDYRESEDKVAKWMEKYTNYRNKVLEDKIKEFSSQLNTISKAPTYPNILKDIKNQYDKHFNIQNNTKE